VSRFTEPVFPAIFTQNQQGLREFDRQLVAALGNWAFSLKGILDGGISLQDNIDAAVASYQSNAVADTEDAVAHTLGRVPQYFVAVDLDKGAVIYRGPTAFTKTTVYLKSTVANTAVKVLLL
jgi:hypothetical protein